MTGCHPAPYTLFTRATYVRVSDIARANLAAVGRSGFEVFNVGTGSETSVVALHELLQKATGVVSKPAHGPARPGEQRRSSVDARRGLKTLDLPSPLGLPEGLAATAVWFAGAKGS